MYCKVLCGENHLLSLASKTLTTKSNRSLKTHHPVPALGARQHQSWVRHVVPQVDVCASAQDPASFLQRDVCFYGNSVGANYRPVSSSLTLDFAAFGVSAHRKESRKNVGG